MPPGPILAKKDIPIHFRFPTRQEAEAFADGLFDPPGEYTQAKHNLVFKYQFSGVGRERCNGQYKAEYAQAADFGKELTGTGSQGNVTRDQAVKLADKVTAKVAENITCSDRGWATYIHGQLINRLGGEKISLDPKEGWEQLDRYMKLDEDSFKADVTEKTKDIKKKAVRDLVSSATSKAWSDAGSQSESYGGAVGWKPFMASASVSFAKADSETKAEATKAFSDIMRKSGILAEWDGTKYTPKSVEVYNVANMRRNLSQDFEINYTFRSDDVSKSYAITLTSGSFIDKKVLDKRLRRRTQELKAEKEAGITQARVDAEKALLWAEAAVWDARKAVQESRSAISKASAAEERVSAAYITALEANWKVTNEIKNIKSIKIKHYLFDNIPYMGKYVTSFSVSEFGYAMPANARFHKCSGISHSHGESGGLDIPLFDTGETRTKRRSISFTQELQVHNERGHWTIYVMSSRCRALSTAVLFFQRGRILTSNPILSDEDRAKKHKAMKPTRVYP